MTNSIPVALAYKKFESSSGVDTELSPVIFLHGITASKEHWDDIPQRIADSTKRRAYALDARNHNDSMWTDNFSFDLNVEDLFHFMDTMAISRAVLIGHSMGGITSMRAALKKAERIEKMFIEDIYPGNWSAERRQHLLGMMHLFQKVVPLIPIDLDEAGASDFIKNYFQSQLPPHLRSKEIKSEPKIPLKRNEDSRYCFKTNLKTLIKTMASGEAFGCDPQGFASCPAYFIHGSESPVQVPMHEENIKKFFPSCELIEIGGAGHDIHGASPNEYVEIILKRL